MTPGARLLQKNLNIHFQYPYSIMWSQNKYKIILILNVRCHLHSRKVSPSSEISSPNIGKEHTNMASESQKPFKSPR